MKRLIFFLAKILLLSHMIYEVANDLLYNREQRAKNFNRKYSQLQIDLAPYLYIPWPSSIYRNSETILLLWNYTKLLVALRGIFWPRAGIVVLKNQVLIETVVNIIGGCRCLCYFLN